MKSFRLDSTLAATLALAAFAVSASAAGEGRKTPPAGVPVLPAAAGQLPTAAGQLPVAAPGAPAPVALPQAPELPAQPAQLGVPAVAGTALGASKAEQPAAPAALAEKQAAVGQVLENAGQLPQAEAGAAHGAGVALENAMTGAQAAAPAASEPAVADPAAEFAALVVRAQGAVLRIKGEVSKVIVGQNEMVDGILMGMVARKHILLEGVPGVAKTETAKAVMTAVGGTFGRIQGMPDMMPSDIVGSNVIETDLETGRKSLVAKKGPIFADLFLADEINRMTPKAQSALLQAMQEKEVTIGDKTFALPESFTVIATKNPIEQEGTYDLPEAQLDRFMALIVVPQPPRSDLRGIDNRNLLPESRPVSQPVSSLQELDAVRRIAAAIPLTPALEDYIERLVTAADEDPELKKEVRYYAYTRASQSMKFAVRIHALFEGRAWVGPQDVAAMFPSVVRHRVFLKDSRRSVDDFIEKALERVPLPGSAVGLTKGQRQALSFRKGAVAAVPAAAPASAKSAASNSLGKSVALMAGFFLLGVAAILQFGLWPAGAIPVLAFLGVLHAAFRAVAAARASAEKPE